MDWVGERVYERIGGIQMETWIPLLTDVGFPIAVTFYLLHRIEGKLNLLIESIHGLPGKLRE